MMKPIADFMIEPVETDTDDCPLRSRLLYQGQPAGTMVLGLCLDAQFQVDQRFLLILNDDVPYEETLRFYLLGAALDVQDQIELGAPYSPGVLHDLRIVARDRLEFSFAENDRWQLTVLTAPQSWIRSMVHWADWSERRSDRGFMEVTRKRLSS